jgi:hypothetical protein
MSPAGALLAGGFIANAFMGYLNPVYVTQILASMDTRVIAVGSVLAAAFPVLMGALMEYRPAFERLYALLPAVMGAELVLTAAIAVLVPVSLTGYYLASMLVFGVFTSSVLYLLQRFKELKIRRNRAIFDRRLGVADGLGYLVGSGLSFATARVEPGPMAIALIGCAQTAVVYGLLVIVFRKAPRKRRSARLEPQEPHPCGLDTHPAAA